MRYICIKSDVVKVFLGPLKTTECNEIVTERRNSTSCDANENHQGAQTKCSVLPTNSLFRRQPSGNLPQFKTNILFRLCRPNYLPLTLE